MVRSISPKTVGLIAASTILAVCAINVLYFQELGLGSQSTVELVDLVDPDGTNAQRVVDVFNDLSEETKSASSKVRNILKKAKQLLDKKLSIIVDTQTLKTGGLPGPPGPKGADGPPGYQGKLGAEGNRGPTGPVGPAGAYGVPGVQGFRGDVGPIGPEGARGPVGPIGEQGFPGPPGPKGPLGAPGARGTRGARGQTGYAGATGAQGTPGVPGPRGPIGVLKALDVTKACQRIGGQVYRGICLRGTRLQGNNDNVPLGCNPYAPAMYWDESNYREIFNLFGDVTPRNPHLRPIGNQGGMCNNYWAVLSYTQYQGNNHVWVRSPTFNWSPPITSVEYACSGWWFWRYCWSWNTQNCNLQQDGNTFAIYACAIG